LEKDSKPTMSTVESDQLAEKITQGVILAIQRLIEKTKKEDGELVISRNGKVVRVKAGSLNVQYLPGQALPKL